MVVHAAVVEILRVVAVVLVAVVAVIAVLDAANSGVVVAVLVAIMVV